MRDIKSPEQTPLSPTSSTLFSESELSKPVRIKLTSSSAKAKKWKDVAREIEADLRILLHNVTDLGSHGNQSPPSSNGSPIVKQLDPRDRQTYGKYPIEESPDLVSCPKCNRPILRHALKGHLDSCTGEQAPAKKAAKVKGKDKVNGTGTGSGSGNETNGEASSKPAKSKKRKLKDGNHLCWIF
jgi:hypothetical protein